jgi:hypothetical protein
MDSSETQDQASARVGPAIQAQTEPDGTQESGCPVCNHLVEATFEFLCEWQYRLSADDLSQQAFADHLGFCPLHTWQLASIGSPQGLSLGYPKLLDGLSAVLSSLSRDLSETAGRVAALLRTSENCQVCRLLQSKEQEHIAQLSHFLTEPAGRNAYAQSQGLCLRHLASLLAASPSPDLARFLLSEAARHFAQLAEDMRNYALKRGGIQAGLPTGDERNAHLRTLIHLAGHKALCVPR